MQFTGTFSRSSTSSLVQRTETQRLPAVVDGIAEAAPAARPGHVVERPLAADAQNGPRPLPARLVRHVAAVAKRRCDPVERQRARRRHRSRPDGTVKRSHLPLLPKRNPNAGAECLKEERLLGKWEAGRWVKFERESWVGLDLDLTLGLDPARDAYMSVTA